MGKYYEFNDRREDARVLGHKTYIGGPCKHGHDGTRYVSSKGCVQCEREKQARLSPPQHRGRYKEQPKPARRKVPDCALPVYQSDFIKPPTRAQLMAGR